MITNKIIPAHIIRLYVWSILSATPENGGVAMQKIGDLIPIIPVEDEPQIKDSGKPYAIYGYAESTSYPTDQIGEGVFSLRVNAPTFGQLTQILNTVSLAFESADIATEALNRFSSNYSNQALTGMRFTNAKRSYTEGGDAAQSEGGPVDGIINISYKYISNLPTPIAVSAQGGLWT